MLDGSEFWLAVIGAIVGLMPVVVILIREWRAPNFYVVTEVARGAVQVRIRRRSRHFPPEAKDVDQAKWSGVDDAWITVGKVGVHDSEVALNELIARAKALAQMWNDDLDALNRLDERAKRLTDL